MMQVREVFPRGNQTEAFIIEFVVSNNDYHTNMIVYVTDVEKQLYFS